jgi:hypothetical protein
MQYLDLSQSWVARLSTYPLITLWIGCGSRPPILLFIAVRVLSFLFVNPKFDAREDRFCRRSIWRLNPESVSRWDTSNTDRLGWNRRNLVGSGIHDPNAWKNRLISHPAEVPAAQVGQQARRGAWHCAEVLG